MEGPRAPSEEQGDETVRERRGKKGRIKGERTDEIWQRLGGLGAVISMECNMAAICLLPFASAHMHSFSCTLCLSPSVYPYCSYTHTQTHTRIGTHIRREVINLPVSAAGIETPKTGLCCVWRECRCTCLQHIILCPSSSPSLCSSPPLHFILSISLPSFLSHVLNPFQP